MRTSAAFFLRDGDVFDPKIWVGRKSCPPEPWSDLCCAIENALELGVDPRECARGGGGGRAPPMQRLAVAVAEVGGPALIATRASGLVRRTMATPRTSGDGVR